MGNCTRHNEKDEGFFVIAMQISNFSNLSALISIGSHRARRYRSCRFGSGNSERFGAALG